MKTEKKNIISEKIKLMGGSLIIEIHRKG